MRQELKQIKASKIAGKMLNKSYELGKTKDAYDCLSFILDFYDNYGIKMPHEWHGWTRQNYAERWENGEGRLELYEWLHSLGAEIEKNYMTNNDLLILETPEGVTPAIYLGNGNIMIVTIEQGVFVMPLNLLSCGIKEVRRIG